jgi:hypothetical protein
VLQFAQPRTRLYRFSLPCGPRSAGESSSWTPHRSELNKLRACQCRFSRAVGLNYCPCRLIEACGRCLCPLVCPAETTASTRVCARGTKPKQDEVHRESVFSPVSCPWGARRRVICVWGVWWRPRLGKNFASLVAMPRRSGRAPVIRIASWIAASASPPLVSDPCLV